MCCEQVNLLEYYDFDCIVDENIEVFVKEVEYEFGVLV